MNKLKRDDESKRSHHALAASLALTVSVSDDGESGTPGGMR